MRRPEPGQRPAFLRVNSVHQGDCDRSTGVHFANTVDAVTQMQAIGAITTPGEVGLAPVLEAMPDLLPYPVLGFHSDNGSEFVNRKVAAIQDRSNAEFTKSRLRHNNDNAPAESMNVSTLRYHFGHGYVPQGLALGLDRFVPT